MTPVSNALAVGGLSLLIAACGGSNSNSSSGGESEQAGPTPLQPAVDQQTLQQHMVDGFKKLNQVQRPPGDATMVDMPVTPSPELGADPGGSSDRPAFSTTNVITAGIDEADVVKYDGSFLYVSDNGSLPYSFPQPLPGLPLTDIAAGMPDGASSPTPRPPLIRIFATGNAPASAHEVARLQLSDADTNLQGIYVTGQHLLALSAYRDATDHKPDIWYWSAQQFSIHIYNIEDPTRPLRSAQLRFDGQIIGSRLIENELFVVSRYTPFIPGFVAYPSSSTDVGANTELLARLDPSALLPRLEIGGRASRSLLEHSRCVIAADDSGFPSLTIVSRIDLTSPQSVTSTCLASDSDHFYMSQRAIYLTRTNDKQQTELFQYGLDTALPFLGTATVAGHLPWRQRDFALYEDAAVLRVFSVDRSERGITNRLTLLSARADEQRQLQPLAQLPNERRPGSIGKPNEELFGIRHLGAYSYAVTFEQTDPFYIIDNRDHFDPRIAGALEIPGVSNHLHPVDTGLILGIGRDANRQAKLELFDVSTPSQPRSIQNWSFPQSSTDAEWEHKAISQLKLPDGTTQLALPFNSNGGEPLSRLLLIAVTPGDEAPMREQGQVRIDGVDYRQHRRAVLHGNSIHFILDERVFSSQWSNPELVTEALTMD